MKQILFTVCLCAFCAFMAVAWVKPSALPAPLYKLIGKAAQSDLNDGEINIKPPTIFATKGAHGEAVFSERASTASSEHTSKGNLIFIEFNSSHGDTLSTNQEREIDFSDPIAGLRAEALQNQEKIAAAKHVKREAAMGY